MDRKKQAAEIAKRFAEAYPEAHIALDFRGPFQLLVAVVLSAQTTDVGVNRVTPVLFEAYPTPDALASADVDDVERIVKPTGFYHNKTKSIIGSARMIVTDFGGEVPDTMEDLMMLPGVARKSANIVLGNAFGKIEGVAVDTHVARLSKRLGLSTQEDPNKIERDLMGLFPREEWMHVSYRFIDHGRTVCTAQRPVCGQCMVNDICPTAFKVKGWRREK